MRKKRKDGFHLFVPRLKGMATHIVVPMWFFKKHIDHTTQKINDLAAAGDEESINEAKIYMSKLSAYTRMKGAGRAIVLSPKSRLKGGYIKD